MGYLRRLSLRTRKPVTRRSQIQEFWSWWCDSGADRLAASVTEGTDAQLIAEMKARVDAIHPDLHWQTGKGRTAAHSLTVSAGGVGELRPLAQRWLSASPPEAGLWQFHAARQRDPAALTSTVTFRLLRVDPKLFSATFGEPTERDRFDVGVHHPVFARLNQRERAQLGFLYLDWLVGEDDVERWIGAVDFPVAKSTNGTHGASLLTAIDAMNSLPDDQWLIARGTAESGNATVVSVRRRLRWIDTPLFDLHSWIVLRFVAGDDGLPTSDELGRVITLEDGLREAVGPRGLHVASVTMNGTRTVHIYSDSEDQNARDLLDRFCRMHGAKVAHAMDPGWNAVQEFS